MVCGLEVDFFFPEYKLVIEADGAKYHGTGLAREQDAEKQAILEAAGYRVIRVTWEQITRDAQRTALRLRHGFDAQSLRPSCA